MTIRPAKCNKAVIDAKGRSVDKYLLEVNLVHNLDRSKEEYLDKYEGVKSEIVDTTRFDENLDLCMTYLGKINMTHDKNLMVEERFPISKLGYTVGNLLDRTECQILLDTGASKSFMSKSYYLCCKAWHSLPKFAPITQRIQVGNGQYVSVLFIIPVIIEIAGHRFWSIYISIWNPWECRLSLRN